MRMPFLAVLSVMMIAIAETRGGDSPLSVSVAVPEQNGERRIMYGDIQYGDRAAHFHVIITNTSDKPQRIWQEWCSWGYYGLTFEFTDANGKTRRAEKKPTSWTRNFPAWWTLAPGESLVRDVHFGDMDTWEGFPRPGDGSQTVTMQAVFAFSPDKWSQERGVWAGRVASKPDKFTFYRWSSNVGQPGVDNIYNELSVLQELAQKSTERDAVLRLLREMWRTRDPLRRPLIGEVMCQLGDQSGVEEVAREFFAGNYNTGRSLEPDGSAAGINAECAALRTLILYGTESHHQGLLKFLKREDDPLRKAGTLCTTLLELSSAKDGLGLPAGYPKERFPIELAIACLDYTRQNGTVVFAADSTWHPQRGCDNAAQAIQNLTQRDFGHRVRGSIEERDKAIGAIKRWWAESQAKKQKK